MNAANLINRAYYLAQVLDPQEEFEGFYQEEGLDLLNEIITDWSSMGIYVPYTNTITINLAEGEQSYDVSPVVVQFWEGHIVDSEGVLSVLRQADAKEFNLFNANAAQMRPRFFYIQQDQAFESLTTGALTSTLYFNPVPDQNYTATLIVKQVLTELTLNQEFSGIPPYYTRPLRYQLAYDLADLYETELPASFITKYEKAIKRLKAINPQDYSVQNDNPFLTYRRYRPWGAYVG
jgi:hypothetical protein